MKMKWLVVSGIAAMTLIGATAGIVLIMTQSVRLDESQTIWMASKSIPEMMKLTGEDVHVPLYNSLVHVVIQIFGNDVRWVRFLSLFLWLGTIPTMYALVKQNMGTKAALLACALLIFSPFVIWYSAEARMYSLLLLATILTHYYFLKLIKSKGKLGKLGYFLSGLAGIFSHYFFWLILLTQGIYLAYAMSLRLLQTKQGVEEGVSKEAFYAYMIICGGLLLMITPWLGYVVTLGGASNTQPLITKPTSYNIVVTMVNFVFGFQQGEIQNVLVSLWPLSAIVLLVAFSRKSRRLRQSHLGYFVLSAVLPIAIVFLVSLYRPVFLSRYLIFVVPSWFAVLGWILSSQRRSVAIGMTALLVFSMSSLLLNQTVSAQTPVKEDYDELNEYLASQAESSDIVAVSTPFTVYPIEYGYRGRARLATIPEWNRYIVGSIPPFEENKMIDQIKAYSKLYQNIFVVLSYDQGFEERILDYMDHNYQMTGNKTFAGGIEVREYKLRY